MLVGRRGIDFLKIAGFFLALCGARGRCKLCREHGAVRAWLGPGLQQLLLAQTAHSRDLAGNLSVFLVELCEG